jgi:PKD domain
MVNTDFTFPLSSGYVFIDDFTFNDTTTTDNKIVSRTWDLGDGTFLYDTPTVTKVYNYPGIYTISLTATDLNGDVSTKTAVISTDYFLRDIIFFDKIPTIYSNPGSFTATPFSVNLTSAQIDQLIILNLFAANSRSTPYQFVPDHWKFLTPTWRFTDKNYNFITSLSVATVPLYVTNSNGETRVGGVSGTAEFYYIDDFTTGDPLTQCPIVLTVTIETTGFSYPPDSNVYPYPGYSNNKFATAALAWRINDILPNTLKVTENYLTDIYPQKWKDVKIPFLITCHNIRNNIETGILFSYPASNYLGQLSSVGVSLSNTNNFIVDGEPLYFQATDKNNSSTGGFIFTTITPTSEIGTTVIQVSTVANFPPEIIPEENEFPFPIGEGANANVWVSNPERNTLNNIFIGAHPTNCEILNYYKDNSILFDGKVTTFEVPKITDPTTYNYSMTGFSGIYGIAVDPLDYSVVTADAELDRLYRFSSTGAILSTYPLSSLGDYIPNKKLFHTWTWTTPSEILSATYFTFYTPAPISTNPNNYILLAGGIHQPNGIISIDPIRNALQLKITPPFVPGNVKVDLIEIFDPQLPEEYSLSLMNWVTATSDITDTFPLTGSPSLSADSNYYIVSVDGALQRPNTYTINNTTKTLSLCSAAPANATINVIYLPSISPPANWIDTYPVPTTSFNYGVSSNINYKDDPLSQFIVNIGGVLQSPDSYSIDFSNKIINFKETVPSNVPVSVTQISVSGDVLHNIDYTPAYVSLDKDRNIWISLFNNVKILKLDPNFNLLATATPNNISWPVRQFTVSPPINYEASLFGDTEAPLTTADYRVNEYFLKPPVVETDRDSNAWATYANPLCSMLVKYNTDGNPIYEIPLPNNSVPVGLAITKQNNVWVSNGYNTTLSGGSLQLYSSTGTLMSAITGMTRPGYVAVDGFNNLWFTYGVREIGYVSTTGAISSWYVSTEYDDISSIFIPQQSLSAYSLMEDEELGGLAIDVFNRVWVIDSLNNKTFVFPASATIDNIRTIKILPDSNIGYFLDLNTGRTKIETNVDGYKSAQATGDWTGNRWYQKYYIQDNLTNRILSGISTPFVVSNFSNPGQIYRQNENFDTANYYKSLALPETLNQNTQFFDTFLGAVVGNNVLSAYEDLGQNVYERIANFTQNVADVDTCNIDQLLSLATETDTPFENYNIPLPSEIKKYLDIASIPKYKLWGIQSPLPLSSESIGAQLNTNTALVTAGSKIVLRNKFDSLFSFYTVPLLTAQSVLPLSSQSVYPLSSMEGIGLASPFLQNYLFFEYNPVYSNTFIENIIDWTNPNTTLSQNISSTDSWYGEGGILENIFNYLLTKNLFVK